MTPTDQCAEVLKNAPVSARLTVERAFSGKASPRQAIKAHCLTCVDFDRAAITDCRVHRCPLWAYRPFQRAA